MHSDKYVYYYWNVVIKDILMITIYIILSQVINNRNENYFTILQTYNNNFKTSFEFTLHVKYEEFIAHLYLQFIGAALVIPSLHANVSKWSVCLEESYENLIALFQEKFLWDEFQNNVFIGVIETEYYYWSENFYMYVNEEWFGS